MKRALGAALASIVATVLAPVVACNDTGTYIFLAQQYEPGNQCVDNYSAVDVISGDDPGALCSPVCITNMGTYYVTSECPPYPPDFGQAGLDGAVDSTCTAALAAFARGNLCVDGGPPTNPLPDGSTDSAATPVDASAVDASVVDSSAADTSIE